MVWDLGPNCSSASRDRSGQRVLDVAAGTGNVALRAAEARADVVALDITPRAGRAAVARKGSGAA